MDIVLRAALAYGFILFLTRVIGRRELSSLQPFDLVMLVVLGDLIQQGVTQSDYSVTGLILAIGTIAVLQAAVSLLNFHSRRIRPLLEGEPIVIIQDGDVIEKNLRRERLTLSEIQEEARLNSIASLNDVRWAVLETNGKISFIPK
jgi:uncharacterized membrane protein YcaP (DUF421 family)